LAGDEATTTPPSAVNAITKAVSSSRRDDPDT
jgi:hypothetical protein